jgi:3-oxo-5-alpha-steroid 4-dehydrogenase 1
MNQNRVFMLLVYVWLAAAICTFVLLFFKTAPYGRHMKRDGGPTIKSRSGWVVMEAVSFFLMLYLYLTGNRRGDRTALVFLGMWLMHYAYRSFLFSPLKRGKEDRIPFVIVAASLLFNGVNAYLNGRYLFYLSPVYTIQWLAGIRFVSGAALFFAGFFINMHSDHILRGLRSAGEKTYRIPYGGLYRWVSCPNYLGEITEWIGWAVATWSLPGAAFAFWTLANLAPRSFSHHRWYRELFDDYPQKRKALVPFLF